MKYSDKFWVKIAFLWLVYIITSGQSLSFAHAGLIAVPVLPGKFKPDNNFVQVEGTDINIRAPHLNIDNQILDVTLEISTVGEQEKKKLNYRIQLRQAKAQIHLPDITEGKVSIHFKLLTFTTQGGRSWQSDFTLTGSGLVEYRLVAGGRGVAMVWPAITASAKAGPLDVYINNLSIGSTNITRGVNPNKEMQIAWKKNDKVICSAKLKLAYNIKRKCICNETDGKVIVE